MNEKISPKHRKMYMRIAQSVALSGTCDRAQVGAVIVKNGCIIGLGYNGSARGDKSCDNNGHIMDSGHCIRTIHAEENAIINAARNSIGTLGATMFCTHKPCYRCCQRVINAGIEMVYFDIDYGQNTDNRDQLLKRTGLKLISLRRES